MEKYKVLKEYERKTMYFVCKAHIWDADMSLNVYKKIIYLVTDAMCHNSKTNKQCFICIVPFKTRDTECCAMKVDINDITKPKHLNNVCKYNKIYMQIIFTVDTISD